MGMNDAIGLANNIIRNLKHGNNIGEEIALKEYESQAKVWNYTNATNMEIFKRVYDI